MRSLSPLMIAAALLQTALFMLSADVRPVYAAGSTALSAGVIDDARFLSDRFDPDRSGSITLCYRNTDDTPVSGAVFSYIRVALFDAKAEDAAVGERYISLIKDAGGQTYPIDRDTDAKSLAAMAQKNYAAGFPKDGKVFRARTGADGLAYTDNLPPGLYLAVETASAKGYRATEPFCFTVPRASALTETAGSVRQKSGKSASVNGWNYALRIWPKAVPLPSAQKDTPDTPASAAKIPETLTPVKTGDTDHITLFLTSLTFAFCLLILTAGGKKHRSASANTPHPFS